MGFTVVLDDEDEELEYGDEAISKVSLVVISEVALLSTS